MFGLYQINDSTIMSIIMKLTRTFCVLMFSRHTSRHCIIELQKLAKKVLLRKWRFQIHLVARQNFNSYVAWISRKIPNVQKINTFTGLFFKGQNLANLSIILNYPTVLNPSLLMKLNF